MQISQRSVGKGVGGEGHLGAGCGVAEGDAQGMEVESLSVAVCGYGMCTVEEVADYRACETEVVGAMNP